MYVSVELLPICIYKAYSELELEKTMEGLKQRSFLQSGGGGVSKVSLEFRCDFIFEITVKIVKRVEILSRDIILEFLVSNILS